MSISPKKRRIAIVGGGASGIFAAIHLLDMQKSHCFEISIFEQNAVLGRKILVSGNGRCNLTHRFFEKQNYHSQSAEILQNIFQHPPFSDASYMQTFFTQKGIQCVCESDGRIFPISYDAKSLMSIFESLLLNVRVNTHSKVCLIQPIKQGFILDIEDKENKKSCEEFEQVIIATGGIAYPQLGSGEEMLEILKGMGFCLESFKPALVAMEAKISSQLVGIRREVVASLWEGTKKKKIVSLSGDLLFTDYGLSGSVILDLSFYLLSCQRPAYLVIDLLPMYSVQQVLEEYEYLCKKFPQRSIFVFLNQYLHSKISLAILKKSKIQDSSTLSTLTKQQIQEIIQDIKSWKVFIQNVRNFKYAEVMAGGVSLREIDICSFESKKYKDLFIIGEVLDIVGQRGGFNLAFAWNSAYCVARAITRLT
ncbi:hypothetical protein CCZ01_00750 [Helicobacter monodelphidis]|uniref:aminoacetone oxidase family FAD-binding enzyme n=1 Tax=Helicobacter sp. 15-1451 TaxID=2004995 RepID=UPI000DCCCA92|nr:aminoacetone oxidase family FAD-binding enzyme [Helicobacter sp. 15-1451]RAX59300.1 hypothetical protein CCZ01_00750 [Helicobacter sp. 15-1451]